MMRSEMLRYSSAPPTSRYLAGRWRSYALKHRASLQFAIKFHPAKQVLSAESSPGNGPLVDAALQRVAEFIFRRRCLYHYVPVLIA